MRESEVGSHRDTRQRGSLYNPSTEEAETVGSGVQVHFWLHSGFKTSLGYMTPWFVCLF